MRDRKINISLVFISETYFKMPKDIRLNVTLFYVKIPKKKRTSANSIKSSV